MTKASPQASRKGTPPGKSRRSRRRRQYASRPALHPTQLQAPGTSAVAAPPTGQPAAPVQRTTSPRPYAIADLKRICIITGAMIILLVVLHIVL